ncbi:MAG TPA: IS66 family transposase [Pseudolabrys sp.]|jgi:transposase|nr:IS66 family transposase [Pseudolabrys sp.]
MIAASPDALPNDVDALHALVLAERAEKRLLIEERDELNAANEKLHHLIAVLRRARFGRKSERLSEDQLALVLEELETANAKTEEEEEKKDEDLKRERAKKRRANRGALPAHLQRIEQVIEPQSTLCPCCGKAMHVIGEEKSERLDKVPAIFRVIVTRRPKYACACGESVAQAPAPPRLIEGGIPTEALIADVVVSKYANHLPLYRQAQIFSRQGIPLDRSTLAAWVGAAAAELEPLYERLVAILKGMDKLFADETRCPVLDPGRGKTKPGYFWALACDNRPWGSQAPPAVIYFYAPGRGGKHVETLLEGFSGILQVDGYDGYNILVRPDRRGGPVTLAYCWAHLRRRFYEIAANGPAPIAQNALERIQKLYKIEEEIRGRPPEERCAVRQARARPEIEDLKSWFEDCLKRVSKSSPVRDAVQYGLNQWDGLIRFLDDGRIEIDSNSVERSMRPIALNRKNSLFAGHDQGANNWACLASLIETCKLNSVNPNTWLTDVLTKLVNRWPARRIDELMPWAYAATL